VIQAGRGVFALQRRRGRTVAPTRPPVLCLRPTLAVGRTCGGSGHGRELEVHQLQGLLHALDVLAAQPHQVGALADVVAQRTGGLVGLEDGRQQAVGVQPPDPLAVIQHFTGLTSRCCGHWGP
jgi:hypothetical protein